MTVSPTPPEVRAWIQSARLLLQTRPAAVLDHAYWAESLTSAADRLRVEQGQCPPVLRRN